MNLKQLEALERSRLARLNRQRIAAEIGAQSEFPSSIHSVGLVKGLSDDERKAWFEKMRKEAGIK